MVYLYYIYIYLLHQSNMICVICPCPWHLCMKFCNNRTKVLLGIMMTMGALLLGNLLQVPQKEQRWMYYDLFTCKRANCSMNNEGFKDWWRMIWCLWEVYIPSRFMYDQSINLTNVSRSESTRPSYWNKIFVLTLGFSLSKASWSPCFFGNVRAGVGWLVIVKYIYISSIWKSIWICAIFVHT